MMRSGPTLHFLITSIFFLYLPTFGAQLESIANGNYESPTTWDCSCLPQPGDTVIMVHDIIKTTSDIMEGHYVILANASLSGSWLRFKGIADIRGDLYTPAFWIEPFTEAVVDHGPGHFINTNFLAVFGNSTLDVLENSTVDAANVEGTGGIWIRGGVLNIENVTSLSDLNFFVLDAGRFEVEQIWSTFYLFATNGSITILNDTCSFYSLQIQQNAEVIINGNLYTAYLQMVEDNGIPRLEVNGDWTNTNTTEGSGQICVLGDTENQGSLVSTPAGSLDICDLSPTATQWPYLDSNTGTVDSTITFCNSGSYCVLATEEVDIEEVRVFPNPFMDHLFIENANLGMVEIFDQLGRSVIRSQVLENGRIKGLGKLSAGFYILHAADIYGRKMAVRVLKQ